MRIEEALRKMPVEFHEQLKEHPLLSGQWMKNGSIKNVLTDPARLSEVICQLPKRVHQLLSALWHRFAAQPFTTEQAVSSVLELSRSEVVLGMSELRKLGVLFTAKKTWGEQIHCIPKDVYTALLPSVIPNVWMDLKQGDAQAELEDEFHQHPLDADLFHFLKVIGMKGELKLTQKGTIHKKELQQLTSAMQMDNRHLKAVGFQYVHCDAYPEAFAVVLDMALRLGIVHQPFQTIRLQTKQWERWLHTPANDRHLKLLELWEKIAFPRELPLQLGWAMLLLLEPNHKYSCNRIWEAVRTVYPEQSRGMQFDQFVDRIILPLSTLGWFGLEHIANETMIWRKQPSEETDQFYVQPNGEVIVPPHLSLPVRWELELLLDKTSAHSLTLSITRDAVLRACQQGRTGTDMLLFLQKHSIYPLDSAFEQLLTEWTSAYGKAQIEEVVLLRFTDKEDADRWLLAPNAESSIASRLTNTIFILHRDKLAAAEKQLKEMNCLPQKRNESDAVYPKCNARSEQAAEETKTTGGDAARGVVYTAVDLLIYDFDTDIPEPAEIYGGLQDIPAMWTKGMRRYHESTMKDVFKKAIELGAKVRLKNGKNEGRYAAPRELIEQQTSWNVRCSSEQGTITLNPKEWEEIQLILPGINDTTELNL